MLCYTSVSSLLKNLKYQKHHNMSTQSFSSAWQQQQQKSKEAALAATKGPTPFGPSRREREETTAVEVAELAPARQYGQAQLSGYIRTGHMFEKAEDGNITGTCKNRGCTQTAADAVIDRNCVGNSRFMIKDDGMMVTCTVNGNGVYARKI